MSLVMVQSEKHKAEEDARIAAAGQVVSPNVYFTKQSTRCAPRDRCAASLAPICVVRVVLCSHRQCLWYHRDHP